MFAGLTNKIFDGLICRDLGGDLSVLEVDYTVDCVETSMLRWAVSGTLIILWPIGLPAVLLWQMSLVKDKILKGDETTLKKFDFVLGKIDPQIQTSRHLSSY